MARRRPYLARRLVWFQRTIERRSVDMATTAAVEPHIEHPGSITEVERHGIEPIPDADRTASPLDLFRLEFGGANTFATVVLGAFPILLFGLSFWQGLIAVLLGVVIGGLILMPMALFAPLTGTNNAVSSGAHFGILGSFLSLLTAITFFAISVYTSGDILVGALDELAGTGRPDWLLAIAYAFFAVAVLVVCLYGFRFMLAVNKVAVVGATALYLLGIVAFAGSFDAGFQGSAGHGGIPLAPALVGATLLVMANPLSFGAFLGDWARYIPRTAPRRRLLGAAFLAQVATIIPFAFGLATATIIAAKAPDFAASANYAGGLVAITPGWFLLPVCIIAVVGGLSTGTTSLYGTGLDFSSVFPFLSRFKSTALIGVLSIGIIFFGRFVLDFVTTISTFATLIIVCTTPWVVIMTIGFAVRRGFYLPDAVQVFNRGQRGGPYWFERGVNWRGMAAWIPAAVVGLLFVNVPGQFEGPLRNVAEDAGLTRLAGVDVSLAVALVLAAVLYVLALALFPEPRGVYGPDGPRLFRAADRPTAPIEGTPHPAAGNPEHEA
jgi:purine-cytosine permease-like protein